MTEKKNITLFVCDFCKKKMFLSHAMIKHELRCSKNPENFRPCLNCKHLEQVEIKFDTGIMEYGSGEPIYRLAKSFFCNAKNILIMHPKADYLEGRDNLNWVIFKNKETEQIPMPKECDLFISAYIT